MSKDGAAGVTGGIRFGFQVSGVGDWNVGFHLDSQNLARGTFGT